MTNATEIVTELQQVESSAINRVGFGATESETPYIVIEFHNGAQYAYFVPQETATEFESVVSTNRERGYALYSLGRWFNQNIRTAPFVVVHPYDTEPFVEVELG